MAGETEILAAISTVGFPIAVTIWLLVKGSRDHKEVKQAVQNNTAALNRLSALIEFQRK